MPDNMDVWNALAKTDPKHTRRFNRGNFSGTDINPQWRWQKLTENFGPVGSGWGVESFDWRVQNISTDEVMVFVVVQAWYRTGGVDGEKHITPPGFGSDYVVRSTRSGIKSDDEAVKKAFTDALGKSFAFAGLCADIYLGRFDDSKYVQDLIAEQEQEAKAKVAPKKTEPVQEDKPDSRQIDTPQARYGDDGHIYFSTPKENTRENWVALAQFVAKTLYSQDTIGKIAEITSRNVSILTEMEETLGKDVVGKAVHEWTKAKLANIKTKKGLTASWTKISPVANGLKKTQPKIYEALRTTFREKQNELTEDKETAE